MGANVRPGLTLRRGWRRCRSRTYSHPRNVGVSRIGEGGSTRLIGLPIASGDLSEEAPLLRRAGTDVTWVRPPLLEHAQRATQAGRRPAQLAWRQGETFCAAPRFPQPGDALSVPPCAARRTAAPAPWPAGYSGAASGIRSPAGRPCCVRLASGEGGARRSGGPPGPVPLLPRRPRLDKVGTVRFGAGPARGAPKVVGLPRSRPTAWAAHHLLHFASITIFTGESGAL